jgi:hypothetical protein
MTAASEDALAERTSVHALAARWAATLRKKLNGFAPLWDERQEQLNLALLDAVDGNHMAFVRRWLRWGADPNFVLPDGVWAVWDKKRSNLPSAFTHHHNTILMRAVTWYSGFGEQAVIDNADVIAALARAGANVNMAGEDPINGGGDEFLETPLTSAAHLDKWQSVKVLLAHHADINQADSWGSTVLMIAADHTNVAMVRYLLNRGANVNARAPDGDTALSDALEVYGSPNAAQVREIVACLLQHGASVEGKNHNRYTVMSLAQSSCDPQLIQMLTQAGAKYTDGVSVPLPKSLLQKEEEYRSSRTQ